MIADVIIAVVCWLLLRLGRRGESARRAPSRPPTAPPADLPPPLVAALLATMLGAFVGWGVAVEHVGLNNTLSAIFTEGEPIAAIVACHRRQKDFVRISAANPPGVIISATCPSGGQINGTAPHVRCTLHGAAEDQ